MDEAFIKRILPHSAEAEQSVIGSMIMDKDAIVSASEVVTSTDFYEQQYSILFDTMLELYNEGKPVDLVTLQARLREKDVPPSGSCSLEFIRDLVTSVPTSANVRYYAQIVKDKAVLRRLIKVTEETANECYLDKEKLENILEKTEKQVFDIVQNRGTKGIYRYQRGSITVPSIVLKQQRRIRAVLPVLQPDFMIWIIRQQAFSLLT